MFSTKSAFSFSKLNHSIKNSGTDSFIESVFAFRGKTNKRYLVFVEEYRYFMNVIKFCTQERKYHPDRFNLLSNLNECSRVITTIGTIMTDYLDKNPYSSFLFVGANLPGEGKENTKRFRLYSKIVSQVISPTLFEHRTSQKNSAYMLINRNTSEEDFNSAMEMFNRIYILDF